MGFNIMDLMNGVTRAAVEGVDNYEAITLNLDEIKVTKHNRYSMDDLEELATSILMDGLQEPLIIGRVNGEYLLSGGHRRREALVILQNEGHTEITQNIPCRFKDMTETQFRLSLLIGNTFNRKMTDYDLMNQAADWKEVLTQARKEKLLVLEAMLCCSLYWCFCMWMFCIGSLPTPLSSTFPFLLPLTSCTAPCMLPHNRNCHNIFYPLPHLFTYLSKTHLSRQI